MDWGERLARLRAMSRRKAAMIAATTAAVAGAIVWTTDACTCLPPLEDTSSASVFVSPTGNDATCARGAASLPCLTFQKAFEVASCGDTVEVASGSYGNVSVNRHAPKESCSEHVTFQEASGATVTMTHLKAGAGTAGPSWAKFVGFTVTFDLSAENGASNVWFSGIDGPGFYINASSDITMTGNDWGPCQSSGPTFPCASQTTIDNPTGNVTIDGDTFHDFTITGAGDHWECMYVSGSGPGAGAIVIRRSRYYNCATYGIYLTGFAAGHTYANKSFTIENNWFGLSCNDACGPSRNSAINLGGSGVAISNILLRHNSFADGQTLVREGGTAGTNNRAIGNIFGDSGCVADVTYTYNAIKGGTCGTGDVNIGAPPYVNTSTGAAGDYHLSGADGSTSADNLVTPTTGDYALTVDRDGDARPNDSTTRDAGADER